MHKTEERVCVFGLALFVICSIYSRLFSTRCSYPELLVEHRLIFCGDGTQVR